MNRQEESRCEETAGHSPENELEIYWASRIRIICADPDLDPYPDLSINKQKGKKNLDFHYFFTSLDFLSLKTDVNVLAKSNQQKKR